MITSFKYNLLIYYGIVIFLMSRIDFMVRLILVE